MANIKKSFNFRNGVQVDDDNLKVSATGLVGIGTTVPTEALDVRGNLVVSGVSSAPTIQAGVATITTLNPTEIIGAGVSIKSGIVTASSGIITYFGDGINLLNLPTSQWEDTIVGAGVSSIYNTGGNVGIATTAAIFTLQVGNDVNSGQKGVGISSFGDIKASGIATASGFVGQLTGDVTGNVTGNITGNVTGNVTGNLTGNVTGNTQGIHTGAVNLGDDVKAIFGNGGDLEIYHTPTGNNSFIDDGGSGGLVIRSNNRIILGSGGNIGLRYNVGSNVELTHNGTQKFQTESFGATVNGELQTDNLRVSGVSTFSGRIEGAATNNVIPFLYNNYSDLPSAGTYHGAFAHVHSFGKAYYAHAGAWFELVNKEADGRVGTGTETYNVGNIVSSGIITATTVLNSPQIGVGTDAPANDIQVRKTGNTEIQVTSDTGIAALTVGRETGTGDTNNAEFRYGGGSGFTYSSAQSLDIVNYGTGNVNYHLSANNAGAAAGDFHWHKGKSNSRLMTLTNTGRLGIGVTQPTQALDIGGNVKVRGTSTFDDIVTIQGGLNIAAGSLSVSSIAADITGNLNGNVNATSGISTFFNIKATDPNNNFAGIGIKTDNTGNLPLDIFGDGASTNKRLFITDDARVGIKTDEINPGIDINAVDSRVSIQSMGVGTTNPQSAVDMRFAGQELTGIFANRMYMYPPQVNNTQRGNLAGVAAGAVIYNTSTNKLQVYNGSAWQDCN